MQDCVYHWVITDPVNYELVLYAGDVSSYSAVQQLSVPVTYESDNLCLLCLPTINEYEKACLWGKNLKLAVYVEWTLLLLCAPQLW